MCSPESAFTPGRLPSATKASHAHVTIQFRFSGQETVGRRSRICNINCAAFPLRGSAAYSELLASMFAGETSMVKRCSEREEIAVTLPTELPELNPEAARLLLRILVKACEKQDGNDSP
jgi:hypothetical protein